MLEDRYDAVASLAEKMLTAAEQGEWDKVILLNRDFESAISALPAYFPKLGTSAGAYIEESIRKMLDCNKRIAALARAWQCDTLPLLETFKQHPLSAPLP